MSTNNVPFSLGPKPDPRYLCVCVEQTDFTPLTLFEWWCIKESGGYVMTMHLLGPAYTTTHTTKRNKKVTTSAHTKMAMDWLDHKRQCKRLGIKAKTFDEYVQYRKGNYKPKLRGTPKPDYKVSDHRKQYPSQNQIGTHFTKDISYERAKLEVSSNYIVGQAYNKGGLVVLSKSEAADPATGKRRC